MTFPLATRIEGTPRIRFLQELFGNSAHFPIANVLLEMLLEGLSEYLRAPDLYSILLAGLVQAYCLSRWQVTSRPRRFLGNLISPALYTIIEVAIEGPGFFTGPHHLAYWGFAVTIGTLQAIRPHLPEAFSTLVLMLEGVTRSGILLALYAFFEAATAPQRPYTLADFFADDSHIFITFAILLLGVSSGLASATIQRYLGLLRQTLAQLRTYSEWLLGRDLLEQIVASPTALTMTQRERTVLFMDIRNFTRWSEAHSPEEVAAMLNLYYRTAETILAQRAIKFKFTADEVMAILPTAKGAVTAALELGLQISQLLGEYNLGAGIGLHTGSLVEGLLGSKDVKFYDAIGDTVNIAKRIESAAETAQVLVSETVQNLIGSEFHVGPARQISVKGKESLLTVFPLQDRPARSPSP